MLKNKKEFGTKKAFLYIFYLTYWTSHVEISRNVTATNPPQQITKLFIFVTSFHCEYFYPFYSFNLNKIYSPQKDIRIQPLPNVRKIPIL